jgi:hypothetical protein
MDRKISVATTFHADGYARYAQRMIQTFIDNWPKNVTLHAYAERTQVREKVPNLQVHDLESACPDLVAFKARYAANPRYRGETQIGPGTGRKIPGMGFKWDAIRFSHKVYAICHAARASGADLLFWMDADMVCHSPISREFIDRMVPESVGVAYLGRKKKFTETGLYALNLRQQPTLELLDMMQACYDNAETDLFTLQEWHDCWVFDTKRAMVQQRHPTWQQLNWSAHLTLGEGHPLVNIEWADYLDHLKGERKVTGRSKPKDLVEPRAHHYWNHT